MDLAPKSVHWLVPEEVCPCDIFLHFRGQYPQAAGAGQPITFAVLEKLAKAQSFYVYVRKADLPAWDAWAGGRHQLAQASPSREESDPKGLYGNKRAELLSYVQRTFQKRAEGQPDLDQAMKGGLEVLQKVIRSPILDWYFQQFHEPPHLFHHNARVAVSAVTFSLLHSLAKEKELENLVFSCLIHELEGDPAVSLKSVVSQQTLALLEKAKRPVPVEVIALIRDQDELCSGKGFPSNKKRQEIPVLCRVFTLCNHFDHYKMKEAISRRARFEHAKQAMAARKADYDPVLWDVFWAFWEKQAEMLA